MRQKSYKGPTFEQMVLLADFGILSESHNETLRRCWKVGRTLTAYAGRHCDFRAYDLWLACRTYLWSYLWRMQDLMTAEERERHVILMTANETNSQLAA